MKANFGKLFIVSAPSGAGKTSLVEEILPRLKPQYSIDRLITYTSRGIRPGEKEGVDFCYISAREFEMRIQKDFFIEWSKDYEHYYGSPKQVKKDLQEGFSRILVIDRNGAEQVLARISEVVAIWIKPPSIEVLKKRLLARGTNSLTQIEKRLELAKKELAQEEKNRLYAYHVLNDNFEEAAQDLEKIFKNELKVL